jgi:hypothetical protein
MVFPEVWLSSHLEDEGMPQKKQSPEEIVTKLRQFGLGHGWSNPNDHVLAEKGQGQTIDDFGHRLFRLEDVEGDADGQQGKQFKGATVPGSKRFRCCIVEIS